MDLTPLSLLANDVRQYRDMRDTIHGDRARVIQVEGISAPAKGFFLFRSSVILVGDRY
jgi:hypothetical protein